MPPLISVCMRGRGGEWGERERERERCKVKVGFCNSVLVRLQIHISQQRSFVI